MLCLYSASQHRCEQAFTYSESVPSYVGFECIHKHRSKEKGGLTNHNKATYIGRNVGRQLDFSTSASIMARVLK